MTNNTVFFNREILKTLTARLKEPRYFIQAIVGPRQVGKTTLTQQTIDSIGIPYQYSSADAPGIEPDNWLTTQWQQARQLTKLRGSETILVLDEIQKVTNWPEYVKKYWDEDSYSKLPLKVVILGSAPLLIQKGLTESLAGRFEITHCTYWLYSEMRDAFNVTLDEYIYFGGYPGAALLRSNEERWRNYILDSLVETTISRDVLLLQRVEKPILLRKLFLLGCRFSARELSYQKIVGQLRDAGNTTTLAHYLQLLSSAWMLTGLEKYSGSVVKQRGSSPKFQVFNNALMSVHLGSSFEKLHAQPDEWGRIVESAVGCHLLNARASRDTEISYWREGEAEVDFVVSNQKKMIGIEVKSGRARSLKGLSKFRNKFPNAPTLVVGGEVGIALEDFFLKPVEFWLD